LVRWGDPCPPRKGIERKSDARAEIREVARRAAEAQIDLGRVRYARYRLLSDALSNPDYDSRADTRQKFAPILSRGAKQLLAMDRYERRAMVRWKVALRAVDEMRSAEYFWL
jgi:hypothetical protein